MTKQAGIALGVCAAFVIGAVWSLNDDKKKFAEMIADELSAEYEDIYDANFEDDSSKI